MNDKSYITMTLCPICQKQNGTLLMDRRLKDTLNKYTIDPHSPCDACKKKYLKHGVLLINPKTCSLIVIKDSAFKRMFDMEIPADKICDTDQAVLERIRTESGVESKE